MFNYNAEKPRFTLAHNRDSRVNLRLLSTIGRVIFATLIFSLTILNQANASETDTAIYETDAERKQFTTSDGSVLSYLEKGKGTPLILIHGWSQSGLQWYNQIKEFSKTHRVIALDLRGHGKSSKVDHGYRVYRLAQDVREVLVGMNLESVILMGHSMGSSILWAYWDLYEGDRIEKMIFVDNSPYPANNEFHTGVHAFKGLTSETVSQMALGWSNDDEKGTFSNDFFRQQFTSSVPQEIYTKALEQHLLLPRHHAANLFVNISSLDLRDVINRISVPSLYVGGRVSLVSWKSIIEQAKQAKKGSYEIFEEDEGGAHFMFLENPTKFNKLVRNFLNQK